MRYLLAALVVLALAGSAAVVLRAPSDADHAAATSREMLMEHQDPPGIGALDGLRFDTKMGPTGKPSDLKDYLQFNDGLFMSRECTDRCNYPPSAYLTRVVDGGTDFIVEAYCPTKNTTMIWRGSIRDETVKGTVIWTSSRWYWDTEQVLEFEGHLSDHAAEVLASR